MVQGVPFDSLGKVTLMGAFGDAVEASLVKLPCCMRMRNGFVSEERSLMCAVSDSLREPGLLSACDYNALYKSIDYFVPAADFIRGTSKIATPHMSGLDAVSENSDVSSVLDLHVVNDNDGLLREVIPSAACLVDAVSACDLNQEAAQTPNDDDDDYGGPTEVNSLSETPGDEGGSVPTVCLLGAAFTQPTPVGGVGVDITPSLEIDAVASGSSPTSLAVSYD